MSKIVGLSNIEVKERIKKGLVNYDTTTPTKNFKEILLENLLTLFNIINLILAIILIISGSSIKNMTFLIVVIFNTVISTMHEVHAKRVVDKLSVISSIKANVIRDGKEKEIKLNKIVKDDVIMYELGNQIVVDSVILDGECEVDESFITGEFNYITKKEGDTLLSGSFIVSGNVICKVINVGTDNYMALISKDAKKIKQKQTEIMGSLKKIVKYVSFTLIPVGILLFYNQFNMDGSTFKGATESTVAALVAMIPEGLMLLVSTVLAISVVKLSKYNVLVQDIYSIETLARIDTLCLDKTGTITEGKMIVHDIIPYNNDINEIDNILEIITSNIKDNNPTINALKDKYGFESKVKASRLIPFSSIRKYSGVTIKDTSYIIGAPEYLVDEKYQKEIKKYSNKYRVLALIKTSKVDRDYKIDSNKELLGLILIKDKIRKEVIPTLEYFKNNDVKIKIISGDSENTVINIAKEVGIDIDGVYDASNLDKEENLNYIIENKNIFVRVKPEQKRFLINTLKNNGHIVAMTGDGVNDVLALKEADCSIVMNSGSDAARNTAELVLLDNNFDSMPKVLEEGRKTINNVERSATLFLSKTIYAIILAFVFMFIDYKYPFIPIQMTLISALTIGIPAFILALEPNEERVRGSFFTNVISKAIPSGLTTVINIIIVVILGSIFSITDGQLSTISVMITTFTALLLIYRISKPLNSLRKNLLVIISIVFLISFLLPITNKLFAIEILTPNSALLLFILIFISLKLFNIFSKLTTIYIESRKRKFR